MGQSGYSDLLSYDIKETALDLSNQKWASRLDPLVAETSSLDGTLYGLTYSNISGSTRAINYNKTLFKKYNVDAPKSFKELKKACAIFNKAGIQPIYQPFADVWHQVLMFAELGPNYAAKTPDLAKTLNQNKATFLENQAMLKALYQIVDLYKADCFGKTALTDSNADLPKAFAQGDVAMAFTTITFYNSLKQLDANFDINSIGLFTHPLGDNKHLGINPAGPTKFVYAYGENQKEALHYLDFLTSKNNMETVLSHPKGKKSLPLINIKPNFPQYVIDFLDEYREKNGIVLQTAINYINPQWMDIGADISKMVQGNITPETVLRNIDIRRATAAIEAGDPAW